MLVTRRLRIHGRVQGVWFRGWAVDVACGLGVDGWVRNRHTGSVEILAKGDEAAVAALIERCWRGPPAARVDLVDVEATDESAPAGFAQLPTV